MRLSLAELLGAARETTGQGRLFVFWLATIAAGAVIYLRPCLEAGGLAPAITPLPTIVRVWGQGLGAQDFIAARPAHRGSREVFKMKEIKLRRSIRKYLDKTVDDAKVMRLLESARLAPSGNNSQPWNFIIIRDEGIRQRIAKTSHDQEWMLTAPLFIACVADIRSRIGPAVEIMLNEDSPQNDLKKNHSRYGDRGRAYRSGSRE